VERAKFGDGNEGPNVPRSTLWSIGTPEIGLDQPQREGAGIGVVEASHGLGNGWPSRTSSGHAALEVVANV
jgi:hypothetical protein